MQLETRTAFASEPRQQKPMSELILCYGFDLDLPL
jgi:hypothetical protein